MGICFPRRICWFSIFLVVQKKFAWKIDLTYLGFWCCRKRAKHFLGILVGLQRTSRPLLWWLQHLQSWHLQKRASASVPMVGQTAGVTFSGGTIPVPSFLAQLVSPGLQARVRKEFSLGMGGEGTNVFPSTSAPAWQCTLNVQPGESWGNQRNNCPLSFQNTLACTLSNIWVEILIQTAEKFQGFQVKFSQEENEVVHHNDTT